MIWPKARRRITIAKSASTRANGVNTERKGKSPNKSWELHLPRKKDYLCLINGV